MHGHSVAVFFLLAIGLCHCELREGLLQVQPPIENGARVGYPIDVSIQAVLPSGDVDTTRDLGILQLSGQITQEETEFLLKESFDENLNGWTSYGGSTAIIDSVISVPLIGSQGSVLLQGGNNNADNVESGRGRYLGQSSTPERASFFIRSTDTSTTGPVVSFTSRKNPAQNWEATTLLMNSNGNIVLRGPNGVLSAGYQYSANTWYKVDLLFDHNTKETDLYVNDQLVASDVGFRNQGNGFNKIHIFNVDYTTSWVDDIQLVNKEEVVVTTVNMVPSSISLSNGEWEGQVIPQTESLNVKLVVSSGLSHGASNTFDIIEGCLPGFYSVNYHSECLACPFGTISSSVSSTSCDPCPQGTQPCEASTDCCEVNDFTSMDSSGMEYLSSSKEESSMEGSSIEGSSIEESSMEESSVEESSAEETWSQLPSDESTDPSLGSDEASTHGTAVGIEDTTEPTVAPTGTDTTVGSSGGETISEASISSSDATVETSSSIAQSEPSISSGETILDGDSDPTSSVLDYQGESQSQFLDDTMNLVSSIAFVVIVLLVISLCVTATLMYRAYSRRKALKAMTVELDFPKSVSYVIYPGGSADSFGNRSQRFSGNSVPTPPPEELCVEFGDEMGNFIVNFADLQSDSEPEMLGKGAFGVVYKIVFKGTLVAVKELYSQNVTSAAVNSFIQEAKIMSEIPAHDNVIKFIGICLHPLCLLTEFMPQGNLCSFLAEASSVIDLHRKVKWMLDMARGMQHLTKNGIVHRDLAARNVLLSNDLVAAVADFGFARITGGTADDAAMYSKADYGPLKWMSVEALQKRKFSEKSDVWSFAITCIEILTEDEPYGPKIESVQAATLVLTEGLRPIVPPAIPNPLEDLLEACWAEKPEERPNFQTICEELESILKHMA